MSVETLALVLHHSKASGTDKLVLLGIANHDGDGGAWPSVATLARYANCTERTVQRTLSKLVDHGELHVDVQAGGRRRMKDYERPNCYRVLVRCPPGCDGTSRHKVTFPQPVPVDDLLPGMPESDQSDRVTPTSPGDAHVTGGVTPTSPEPSLNHPSTHQVSTSVTGPRASVDHTSHAEQARALMRGEQQ